MKKTLRESIPFVMITGIAEIAVGSILLSMDKLLPMLPGLLFLLPGLMGMRGNISSSLAQRLTSAIHIGLVSWEKGYNKVISENVKASISLSVIVSAIQGVGVFVWAFIAGIPMVAFWIIIFIAVLTASLSGVVQALVAVFTAVYSAYRGLDPDNVTIPLLATVGDVITILFVLLTVNLVLMIPGFVVTAG